MAPSEPHRLHVVEDCDRAECVATRSQLAATEQELERIKENLDLAEKELRAKRSIISRLRGERNKASQMSPFWPQAEQCFARWNEVCRGGKAKEFSGPRAENTVARLEATHATEDVFEAIEGARAVAAGECNWKPRPPFDRLTELATICESEAKLLRYQGYAREAKQGREESHRAARHTFLAWNDQNGTSDGRYAGLCPACQDGRCEVTETTEFRCANGCAPDDIQAGLKKWWVELYPDRHSRRIAIENIKEGERLDAQVEAA